MAQTDGVIGIDPSQVKIAWHDETIQILNEIRLDENLKECHKLRAEDNLKELSDIQLIVYVLRLYAQKKIRKLNRKKKKGLGDGNEA